MQFVQTSKKIIYFYSKINIFTGKNNLNKRGHMKAARNTKIYCQL